MLGFFEKKKADVLDHWYALIPSFNTSTKEFYEAVERELKERQVPGLEITHIDFAEGGVLSRNREYLRMTRERLVFDICAAPFGTAFFFSCRFAEIPAAIQLWQLLVVLVAALTVMGVTFKVAGYFLGAFFLLAGFVALIYLLRNAVSKRLSTEARKPFFILESSMSTEDPPITPIEPDNTGLAQRRNGSSVLVSPDLCAH